MAFFHHIIWGSDSFAIWRWILKYLVLPIGSVLCPELPLVWPDKIQGEAVFLPCLSLLNFTKVPWGSAWSHTLQWEAFPVQRLPKEILTKGCSEDTYDNTHEFFHIILDILLLSSLLVYNYIDNINLLVIECLFCKFCLTISILTSQAAMI